MLKTLPKTAALLVLAAALPAAADHTRPLIGQPAYALLSSSYQGQGSGFWWNHLIPSCLRTETERNRDGQTILRTVQESDSLVACQHGYQRAGKIERDFLDEKHREVLKRLPASSIWHYPY